MAEVTHLVRFETSGEWARQDAERLLKLRRPVATVILVPRGAQTDLRLGRRGMVYELRKFNIHVEATTVPRTPKDTGIHPFPDKAFKKPAAL